MKIKNLVYLPTGLNSPENEVLSATVQSLLDKNQDEAERISIVD